MSALLKLKQRRGEIVSQMETLDKEIDTAGDKATDEQRSKFTTLKSEHDSIVADITRKEEISGFRKQADEPEDKRNAPEPAGDDKNKEKRFTSLGEQLLAVVRAERKVGAIIDPRLIQTEERAAQGLNESVGGDGGFLVQEDFSKELLKRAFETGILSKRVKRIPISANANGLRMFGVDETSRADGSRWGGVQTYWTDEAAQKTKSKPKFREMNMKLHKLTGLCYATDELLQDAVALEAIIKEAFAEEIAFKIDDAILRGDGVGKPLGILNANALVSVAAEGGQSADTILFPNVVNMYSRIFSRSLPNAVWIANQNIIPQLFKMVIAGASSDVPVYLPANGVSGQPYDTLFGKPILFVEHASSIGDVGDLMLVDLSQYLMIDKGGIQSASSIHLRFDYDETVFRFVYRCDGQPTWSSALTPYKGSQTQSPYIALAAR